MFKTIEQKFEVSYRYGLYFTENLFGTTNTLFRDIIKEYKNEPVKLLFVIDDGVALAHPQLVKSIETYCQNYQENLVYMKSMVVQGGEACKNDQGQVEDILKAVSEYAICRHSFVVVIGGGAVIDMTGYAAAIAHRGVKLIRIPTTVLSQDDSAVGVKNSVNAFGKKNFIGTFAPPYAIINDTDFLKTLEQRDWIAGISEALKVALIKDAVFFEYLEKNAHLLRDRNMEAMQYTIYRCAEMHMHHIAQGGDPFESGSSRPLDFGHWAAHKLEYMTNYALRHGEAVAKGIVLDVAYAHLIGLINEADLNRIVRVFQNIGFDLSFPLASAKEVDELLNGIEEFREHLGGELTITLISDIGVKHDVHEIDREVMKKALDVVNEISKLKVE
ncbi:3-dehydroquinate synthase [Zobellia galactanivorans]|uniref:3-dehydroquinate synthase n=1 Tax=Zobellia galactanivorans (strain DSM 12802 / CCUG 47099 / CIP 106680 / NCIMB 13871 / Dsij) TaxID=63186 RepID=UPI0026E3B8A1|nr:3-dehydroquinate synthase [Zobellia galactanivorans]MDO6810258.1 3-dehydroquinate synthase [Zobellia galactanivorans]